MLIKVKYSKKLILIIRNILCIIFLVIKMNEENLITYYNKFNEDKRLTHRHGIIEFNTLIRY